MSHNRRGMILVDKWNCRNCGHQNDPEADNCYNCGADQDGEIPKDELDGEIQ